MAHADDLSHRFEGESVGRALGLERVLYARDPDRHEYRLTAAGRDLFPAIVALMRWGDAYLAGRPPLSATDRRPST